MTKLIVMCGIMGSGKTTKAKEIALAHNAHHLSSDAIRLELFGSESHLEDGDKVFKTLYDRARYHLSNGENVVIDAMNISRKRRIHFLTHEMRGIKARKIIVYMATPFEKCIENDKKRDRHVGYTPILNAYKNLDVPIYAEGWDDIVFSPYGDIKNIDLKVIEKTSYLLERCVNYDRFKELAVELFPSLEEISDLKHHNPHHTYDVMEHTYHVLKNMRKLYGTYDDMQLSNESVAMKFSALFHDSGKAVTKAFRDSNGNISEKAHYYGHEKVSAQIAVAELLHNGFNDFVINMVNELVQFHMDFYKAPKKNGKRKVESFISKRRFKQLEILNDCDRKAH